MIYKKIFLITIYLNPSLWKVLNSTFFQSMVIIVAAVFTALAAIWSYYDQQRINRLQKIYFEDTLVTQLKNLEKALSTKDDNIVLIETSMNFLSYALIKANYNKELIIKYINQNIDSFNVRKHTLYSTKETLIMMLGNDVYATHLAQWIDMFELDMTRICEEFRGQLIAIRDYLTKFLSNSNKLIIEEELNNRLGYIRRINLLNRRHLILLRFFPILIELYGEHNLKTKKALFEFCKQKAVQKVLKNADTAFKLLFGFYKINESIYISYAKNKLGERIKLERLPTQNSWQLAIADFKSAFSEKQFFIIRNQDFLATFSKFDDGDEIKISEFLCDIVEMNIFGKKREFFPTLDAFDTKEKSTQA